MIYTVGVRAVASSHQQASQTNRQVVMALRRRGRALGELVARWLLGVLGREAH